MFGGEHARVGLAVGRELAGLVFVAVQAVHGDGIENLQIALAHPGERAAVQPRVVRDEADDALAGLLDDAPLGHAEEADVEVVQTLPLRRGGALGRAVGIAQVALLFHRQARVAVVGRVAEDDDDG